ncbi:MAG: hypothetical protein SFU57_13650 [Gemmatimonadales bacterium]|nr:hypothetical protein [Gemmatimonadales bacterium]MDZ4259136.1 hypothetical protein [Gemmatimonadales bacterium]MDZ4391014.1 hypothetical protein [Gemmatimonadales bacterium]
MTEFTLGGYMAAHDRAAAFTGSDDRAYSVALWVDEAPDANGRFPAALLFIRWDRSGNEPDGHLETPWIVWGETPDDASQRLGAFSLYDVKAMLDEAIAAAADVTP